VVPPAVVVETIVAPIRIVVVEAAALGVAAMVPAAGTLIVRNAGRMGVVNRYVTPMSVKPVMDAGHVNPPAAPIKNAVVILPITANLRVSW
jgi:hypothetical protein